MLACPQHSLALFCENMKKTLFNYIKENIFALVFLFVIFVFVLWAFIYAIWFQPPPKPPKVIHLPTTEQVGEAAGKTTVKLGKGFAKGVKEEIKGDKEK